MAAWEVEYTNEFEEWWLGLTGDKRESIAPVVGELEERGPHVGFPRSSGIRTSRHSVMRELRIQHRGDPYRILYAFDPRRVAILLIGGRKAGDDRWYERYVPYADWLYDVHLAEIAEEERRDG